MRGHAVVVGAGIGGLGTAIGLRDAGWTVTVLERWPRVVGIGAALGVWPEAQAGLSTLGIAEGFRADSVPVAAAGIYRSEGRSLLRMPEGSKRIPAVRLISRRRLMNLLVAAADGIEIRTGVTADAPALRDALATADVLVGADGLRSGVRSAFFGDRTARGTAGWSAGAAASDSRHRTTARRGATGGCSGTPRWNRAGRTSTPRCRRPSTSQVPSPTCGRSTPVGANRSRPSWPQHSPTMCCATRSTTCIPRRHRSSPIEWHSSATQHTR